MIAWYADFHAGEVREVEIESESWGKCIIRYGFGTVEVDKIEVFSNRLDALMYLKFQVESRFNFYKAKLEKIQMALRGEPIDGL